MEPLSTLGVRQHDRNDQDTLGSTGEGGAESPAVSWQTHWWWVLLALATAALAAALN